MDSTLKQRLIGAAVLAALAIIFLPMLLKGPDVKEPDAAQVPLSAPAAPDSEFETRELPLAAPEAETPPGGVLGMNPQAPAATPAPETPAGADAAPVSDAPATPAIVPPVATTPTPAASAKTETAKAEPAKTEAPKPAVASPEPAKPALPAAVAGGKYAVNIGSFGNLANANALVARLKAEKLPVLTDKVQLNGADALRVRLGPYADRTAAEAARLRADAVAGSASKVIVLDAVAAAPAAKSAPAPTAPAAAKPSAAPATSAPASSGFAVQLAAPSVEADALKLRDRARALGFASFVQRVDTDAGARFRVRLGPVADRSAAEAMRDSANQKLGIAGIVVAHP